MPAAQGASGVVKIRQVYSRAGYNYYAVTLSRGLIEALGWTGGMYLMFYPTKDGGVKFLPRDRVSDVFEDVDTEAIKASGQAVPERGPRPGSVAFAEMRGHQRIDEMLKKAEALVGRVNMRDDERDEELRRTEVAHRRHDRMALKKGELVREVGGKEGKRKREREREKARKQSDRDRGRR